MSTPSTKKKDPMKCITPEFRVSFPHLFKAHSGFEGQEPKFSLTMLFQKEGKNRADLTALKAAATAAAVDKWGPDKAKWPKKLRMPFRDGDEKEDLQGYKGTTFVMASSKQQPGVVNKDVEDILTPSELYAGCYARATLRAFAYDTAGNKGVSFGLQNVQKLRDGESFSGRTKASDDFDSVEDNSDDEDSYTSNNDSDDEDDSDSAFV